MRKMKLKRSSRPAKNRLLAEKILAWSQLYGLEQDPYLKILIDGLLKKRNLAMLSEIDALEHFPRRKGLTDSRKFRLIPTLTIIRNVAVFAPVALTWSAVSHSTGAFAKYVNENPDTVANFLEFWQNGYGYLSREWTIGTVAYLDFLIIIVVIFLTLFISLKSNQEKLKNEIDAAIFLHARLELAIEVRKFLHDKRRITNVTMNQSLASAIQNLNNATLDLDNVVQKISNAEH